MSLRASNYITSCGIPIFDYINVQYLTMVVIETYRVHKLDIYVFLSDIKTIRLKTDSRQIIFFLSRTINNISEKDK